MTIQILTGSGSKKPIEAIDVTEHYAIHVAFNRTKEGFSVTHKASGLSIWRTKQISGAIKVAHYLEELAGFPHEGTSEELFDYVENTVTNNRLTNCLSSIAPLIGKASQ